jgi:hypothetical protein
MCMCDSGARFPCSHHISQPPDMRAIYQNALKGGETCPVPVFLIILALQFHIMFYVPERSDMYITVSS